MIRNKLHAWINEPQGPNEEWSLRLLRELEDLGVRAIKGIGLFLVETTPDLFRIILKWLRKKLSFAVRLTYGLVRVTLVVVAWLTIVFVPLISFPGWLTCGWLILALIGSAWGLRRELKRRTEIQITAAPYLRNTWSSDK